MTDDTADEVYARYRDALGRGHRAARLGRGNAALLAYAEAAAAAPDRALPYVAMGTIHLEADRAAQALDSFDAALRRSPRDGAALRGRADALGLAGQPAAAATTLDLLVETCVAEGRVVEALGAARRGLEMAESRERRRVLVDLVARVRTGAEHDADVAAGAAAELEEAERLLGSAASGDADLLTPEVAGAVASLEAAALAIPGGDRDTARRAYLDAAKALASADLRDAALDACFCALEVAPDDLDIHLTLAEIYAHAGWHEHLTAKAEVLDRFFGLGPYEDERARLAAILADAGR
jgi:tetratricopeptide (TPR) repeat protein